MEILKKTLTKNNNDVILLGNANHKKTLVIGVFHGDEPQGKFLIENYIKNNPQSPLLFIPCLNPDGMAKNTRTNANGVDLNRNFPTENWEFTERTLYNINENPALTSLHGKKNEFFGGEISASEIETQFLIDIIEEYKPQLILTLHAPFKVVNYDGNAKEISKKISKIINYPVEENIGYPTPGSFGTYCGVERNIPTITLELDDVCPIETLVDPVNKIFSLL